MFVKIALWSAGIIIILCVIIYAIIRYRKRNNLVNCAIITDKYGMPVKGIAINSVHLATPDDYLITVRIALFCKGMIYLKERSKENYYEPGKWDIPFEYFFTMTDKLKAFTEKKIAPYKTDKEITLRHSLKYMYHDEKTARNIYLYYIYLDDEKDMKLEGGKLWTMKQIEQNLQKDVFCPIFEKELEHYKITLPVWETYQNK